MALRHLLVGASALAFAANASAQANQQTVNSTLSPTTVGTPANNPSCSQPIAASTANECVIYQNGSGNTATTIQNGNGNYSLIDQEQNSNLGGGAVSGNTAYHNQGGDRNAARTFQKSNNNNSQILQLSTAITGQAGNTAMVTQQTGTNNFSYDSQYGRGQSVTVAQTGRGNTSVIVQGAQLSVGGGGTLTPAASGGVGVNNTATVNQNGSNEFAQVVQQLPGGAPNAQIIQGNSANVNLINNAANFSAAAQPGNVGFVTQTSNSNTAFLNINNGDVSNGGANARNFGQIVQSNGTSNVADVSLGSNDPFRATQNSTAIVSQSSGVAATGSGAGFVPATGGNNYVQLTIGGGVSGNDPVSGLNGGNFAQVSQQGNTGRSTAVVTMSKSAQFQGLGNSVNVTQTANAAYTGAASSQPQGSAATANRIAVNEPSYTQAATSSGELATVWSYGRFNNLTLNQDDAGGSVGAGTVYRDAGGTVTGVARARAALYQGGQQNGVNITQSGDNYADVTQGRLGTTSSPDDRNNALTLTQVDRGDGGPGNSFDQFGNAQAARGYNQFIASQYGLSNTVTANQNAVNAFMNVFQGTDSNGTRAVAAGSTQPTGLYADLRQGTGDTNAYTGIVSGKFGVTPALQGGPAAGGAGLNSGPNSVGTTLKLVQGGTNNGAMSYQDSATSFVNITQLGSVAGAPAVTGGDFATGTAGGANVGNLVFVQQQGTSNRATAVQTTGAGRSTATDPASGNSSAQNSAATGVAGTPADDFYFAGGARSSGITILQGGVNNRAYAEQRGKGQYARIEQGGSNNEAAILQEVTATNATAIIRQSGTGNTYYVDQTNPGQYIAVDQAGTNNATTNRTSRGGGGTDGFSNPGVFPAF